MYSPRFLLTLNILLGIVVVAVLVLAAFFYIYHINTNFVTFVSILSTLLGALVGVLAVNFKFVFDELRKYRELGEQAEQLREQAKQLREVSKLPIRRRKVTPIVIPTLLKLMDRVQSKEELLNVERESLALERRRLDLKEKELLLDNEQQILGWQKEALAVVEVSPRSAIIIAWLGVELELKRTANRLGVKLELHDTPFKIGPFRTQKEGTITPSVIISSLLLMQYINELEAERLSRMKDLRNRVVHAAEEKEVLTEEAIRYVQEAISMTQKLSSVEEKPHV